MHTGQYCTTTGDYRSACSCRTKQEVKRGDEAPKCPTCGRSVDWLFQIGTYRGGASSSSPPTEVRLPSGDR